MKVTKEFLREKHACAGGYKWFCENCLELGDLEAQIKHLSKYRYDWANWLLVRLMSLEQKRKYAIFAAKKVLHIFEAKYPTNTRPRKAIKAAEKVLENDTKENRSAAAAAAEDAYIAYDASDVDAASVYVYAAAASAADAATAAYAAADTATYAYAYADAATAAADAAAAADDSIKETIINKGIELIKKDIKK